MRHLLLLLALAACGTDISVTKGDQDADEDGYTVAIDCDDDRASVHPEAEEVCDGIDQDCDGEVDEDATDMATFAGDADGDGYGDDAYTITACEAPAGYAAEAGDCDDADARVHPGAPETDCTDPVDYNCDGSVTFADADRDGVAACEDCDDTRADVAPGAREVCDPDDVDEDCSGAADDDDPGVDPSTYEVGWRDGDGDGYGDPDAFLAACDIGLGPVDNDDDCDDRSAAVSPAATEVCDDGIDNDCDGTIDEDCGSCSPGSRTVTVSTYGYDGMAGYPLDLDDCGPGIGPCCAPTTTQEQMDAFCLLAGYCEAESWTIETMSSTTCYCWGSCSGYEWYSPCCSGTDDRTFVTEVVCR